MKPVELNEQQLADLPRIHESRDVVLYLDTNFRGGGPVVIKAIVGETASRERASRLENEYRLTVDLQLPGARRARAPLLLDGRTALALEYFEGSTLEDAFVRERRSLAENLHVAAAVASALEAVHRQNLVHRHLSSRHILVSPSRKTVMLIGFGRASRVTGQGVRPEVQDLPVEDLAYASPEQTGRVNRVVDRRADLYSLGVVLYELFSGRLPFVAQDVAELVHCHLAQNPEPPHEVSSAVPRPVSDIVMRLLAKNPDQRYQSADGLDADLRACLSQLEQRGRIETLELGLADYSSALRLPDPLSGREAEWRALKEAVTSAGAGTGRVVLVSGPAGVGKTALVEALRRRTAERGGCFIEGSYDASKRHLPYTGLIRAFGELIDSALTESAAQLAQWKERILGAVRGDGGLLTEILPRLELIIGPQTPASSLGPTDVQHRFQRLLARFALALARPERPLTLFLDNLQWADEASQRLLTLLLPRIGSHPVAFIGAYRSDEVGAGHPLAALLASLEAAGTRVESIHLNNLSLDAVSRLVADGLDAEVDFARPLAQLVLEKTAGNPLFVLRFLQALAEDGLLAFDADGRQWTWDAEAIRRMEIAGGVAALVAEKIEKLPVETRSLLSLAACIGASFELRVLADVAAVPAPEAAERIGAAIEAGLVQRSTLVASPEGAPARDATPDARLEFAHDRVRQHAYAFMPRKQCRQTHLRIGRLLLEQTPEDAVEERVFEIADQLNEGFQYIGEERERLQLVALNLAAGRKAKRAAAYQPAIRYLSMGIGLLPADRWESSRELARDSFLEAIEAEYLSANFERAQLLSAELLEHVTNPLERVRVYDLQILLFSAQGQGGPALEAGSKALAALDAPLPGGPEENASLALELQQAISTAVDRIEDLASLPEMTDPRHLATMRTLMHMTAPAQRANPDLLEAIIDRMVLLAVRHGNSPMAAFAYGWHGALECGHPDSIERGYRFGQVALEILREFPEPELEAKVGFLFHAYVRHWKEDARASAAALHDVARRSAEVGDLEYASHGAVQHAAYLFCTGAPLELVRARLAEALEAVDRSQLSPYDQLARVWMQMLTNLCEGRGDPTQLAGDLLDDSEPAPASLEEGPSLLMFSARSCRMMLQFLLGDYAGALRSGRLAARHGPAARGLLAQVNHTFYFALAVLAHHAEIDSSDPGECLLLVAPLLGQLRRWAALAPMNVAHRLALVEAEHARVAGEDGVAFERFNEAIRLARRNGFLHDEAVAREREATFYRARGREDFAGLAVRRATEAFRAWGASRKVEDLERRFESLVRQAPPVLDTAAVVEASQLLSQEIRLERLLERLLRIVIENAGAERGVLIQRGSAGLVVRARTVADGRVETLPGTPIESSGEVALSVVNYVARTQRLVVLGNAWRDVTFGADPHLTERRVQSLLCLPITHQGRLSGLLYLENDLAADVFTSERLELLTSLASQAAISMENAGLYAELESNVAALERAEAELRRYRDDLEVQVQRRTAELSRANSQLVQEIAERRRIQEALEQTQTELERRVLERTAELRGANERLTLEIDERKRTDEALLRSERRFRAIFHQTFQFIGVLTVDGILVEANQAALQFAGVNEDAVLGKPFWETPWWSHSVEMQQRLRAAIQQAAAGELVRFEATHPMPDGRLRYIDFSLKPVEDAEGRVVQLIPEGRDITERKAAEEEIRRLNQELEARVVQRTSQLETANEELESFAYSVSHDLRAPLRHIDGFVAMLEKKLGATTDEPTRHYLDQVSSAARRMGTLIDDLLSFSRMGRNEMTHDEVHLGALVEEVCSELEPELRDRAVEWNVADLPVVRADQAMLRVVLTNLLSNAVKFTRVRSRAEITIGTLPPEAGAGNETIIFVRDNGVGFDMKYANKLFGVFQRLHGPNEFEGTGIGLASVRRIVGRHGGRAWAEGKPDAGATFYFSIPK